MRSLSQAMPSNFQPIVNCRQVARVYFTTRRHKRNKRFECFVENNKYRLREPVVCLADSLLQLSSPLSLLLGRIGILCRTLDVLGDIIIGDISWEGQWSFLSLFTFVSFEGFERQRELGKIDSTSGEVIRNFVSLGVFNVYSMTESLLWFERIGTVASKI